jgi:hypothetical protein
MCIILVIIIHPIPCGNFHHLLTATLKLKYVFHIILELMLQNYYSYWKFIMTFSLYRTWLSVIKSTQNNSWVLCYSCSASENGNRLKLESTEFILQALFLYDWSINAWHDMQLVFLCPFSICPLCLLVNYCFSCIAFKCGVFMEVVLKKWMAIALKRS